MAEPAVHLGKHLVREHVVSSRLKPRMNIWFRGSAGERSRGRVVSELEPELGRQ